MALTTDKRSQVLRPHSFDVVVDENVLDGLVAWPETTFVF